MKPSSFQIESSLSPAELRASLSKRCREWRWPPAAVLREVGIERLRITGGPDRFRMWIWPRPRATIPVLDCRVTAKPGGGCIVHVRMRRSRQDQLSGLPAAAWLGGLPWAAGWGSVGLTLWGLFVGSAFSLYALYGSFQKGTEQRMVRLVETLRDAADPEAATSVRRGAEFQPPLTGHPDARQP